MSKNPITFNDAKQFVDHVLPEPTEGAVPTLKNGERLLKNQRTALHAERDQAQATVSSATQQIADMAIKGKTVKAINEVLAEAAHARALIATIDEQLNIVSKASSLIGSQLFHVMRDDGDWQQYIATSNKWRQIFRDALIAVQREHLATEIQPAHVTGHEQQKAARVEAVRANLERWRESMEDLADELLFKFERENQEPSEDGTTKRRLRSRQ